MFGGCNRAELHDPESLRRQGFVKSVGSRSLEGSSIWGRLGLVFCYSCTPTLFSNGLISTWRVAERFLLSSSISFLITRLDVILCLHLSSLLFKLSFYC